MNRGEGRGAQRRQMPLLPTDRPTDSVYGIRRRV